ncbi:hypothetical protein [Aquabacterium sp.]|uniref:hypothetical protein n=1 Tax=Aquabacterium sp. TaxID=1872578 RepID=UPI002489D640|nr:hypothetical protein [Aquabacterium sp.]MDI1349431.1 hypothetical protein [Aquabacterium sp.]
MVALVEYLDTIAREKKRDVLYVDFRLSFDGNSERSAWQYLPIRSQLIDWFASQGIGMEYAIFVVDDSCLISPPYQGEFYIDVPYDAGDPRFCTVLKYMENEDGSGKIPGVRLCCLQLSTAERYAYRDAPGFIDSLI